MHTKRLVVVGGGAAGFFCAVNAARLNPSLEVVIVEKTSKLLAKVKISGGGRCNVTHHCFSIAEMIRKYPRGASFLKKSFHHFFTTDTIEWFRQRGVELKAEADGRMFPVTDSSQTIIDCLMKEAGLYQVSFMMNREINGVRKNNHHWTISFKDGNSIVADYVCIATGGYPKSEQFNWLQQTGHSIEAPVPSLFTFNIPGSTFTQLMGMTVSDVSIKIGGTKYVSQGPLLFTHWGFSGPAVLKLSAFAARELAEKNWQFTILVNWLPAYNENTLREKLQLLRFESAAKKIINGNIFGLPQRLWQLQLQLAGINEDMRWADLPAKEQNQLVKNICVQEFAVKGKTTFKEEFVTAGGIKTAEVDFNTMESRLHKGLYFAGEALDIDGVTGGFNFQNAWTTGMIAATAIAIESNG